MTHFSHWNSMIQNTVILHLIDVELIDNRFDVGRVQKICAWKFTLLNWIVTWIDEPQRMVIGSLHWQLECGWMTHHDRIKWKLVYNSSPCLKKLPPTVHRKQNASSLNASCLVIPAYQSLNRPWSWVLISLEANFVWRVTAGTKHVAEFRKLKVRSTDFISKSISQLTTAKRIVFRNALIVTLIDSIYSQRKFKFYPLTGSLCVLLLTYHV